MNANEELELSTRMKFAEGQIMEALVELVMGDIPRAERALRYALAELNGTARAGKLAE